MGTAPEYYVLDSYWCEQLFRASDDWANLLDSLQGSNPFFFVNLLSFSIAWKNTYPNADEAGQAKLLDDFLQPLAGLADLSNRGIVEDSSIISAKNRRVVIAPDTPNLLYETMCLTHEYGDLLEQSPDWQDPEPLWVLATFNVVSSGEEPTYLLVQNVEPYLLVDPQVTYHNHGA